MGHEHQRADCLRNGGTLNLGSLVGSGEIAEPGGADGTVTYVIGARGENCTFDGTIRNSTAARIAALTKTGAATLKLTSTTGLTYTGATNVNEGTLMVNGTKTGGGSITVKAHAILAGTGSLAGITTVQGFGVISPGDPTVSSGIGNLSFSSLTLSADSILDIDFGTGNDTATVSTGGTLTLNSGAKVDVGGFGADGTYTLIPYSGATVSGVASTALSVLNGNPAKIYVFKDTGSAIVLEISSEDPNNFWNVDGGGTWNAAGSWTKNLIPNAIEAIARIGPGVGGTGTPFSATPLTITLDANQTVGTLAIDDATAFSIDSGANPAHSLLFDNGVSASILSINSGSQIINAPVAVDAQGLAVSVGTSAALTMNGQVSGASAALVKSGDGPLTLAGTNTYGGGTNLSGGSIVIGNNAALGDAAGALTFSGGTLRLSTDLFGVTRDYKVAGTSNARIDTNGFGFDYAGVIGPVGGGTGGLVKIGTGYLALTAAQSYTGSTSVDGGSIILSQGGSINGTTLGMTAASGVLFHVDGGSFSGTSCTVPITATGLRISSGSATFTGALAAQNSDAGTALIRVEGGDLNAASISVGRASINNITAEPANGATSSGLVISEVDPEVPTTVDITGALTISGSNSTANARMDGGTVTVGGAVTIGLNNTTRWSVLDVNGGTFLSTDTTTGVQLGNGSAGNAVFIVQDGGVAKANKFTFRADGTAAYTGMLKVSPLGTLYVGSGGMVRTGSNALCTTTVKHLGGVIGAMADWSSPIDVSLAGADCEFKAADDLDAPYNITLNGVVSGTGNLLKSGSGKLTLGGVNTYTSNTTVSAGELVLADNAGLTFVIGDNGVNNKVTGSGTATIEGDFTFDLTGAVATDGNTWTIVANANKSFTSTFTVNGFSDPEDDGTWTFTDANNKKWTFTESSGLLEVGPATGGTAYDTWIGGFGLTGNDALPGTDFDNDGLKNLQEFVLGGNPTISQSGIRPSVAVSGVNLVMTFKRSDASEQDNVAVKVQTSTTLAGWSDDTLIGATDGTGPNGITYTVAENEGTPDTIVVTIPKGTDPKKMARVVTTK